MVAKHYVEFLQEMERVVLDRCNGHRRKHSLSSLGFNEDCEVERCGKDCPLVMGFSGF